jgi:hypothetical protein
MDMTQSAPQPGAQSAEDSVLARYRLADQRRRRWDAILRDAYRYTLPEFETGDGADEASRGSDRRTALFDSTGADALDEKAARTHGQLFPPFQHWMSIQDPTGRFGPDAAPSQALVEKARAAAVERFHDALDISNFHTEIAPALREAYVSLGCINVNFGSPENPLSFEAVPVSRVVPEEAPDGIPRTVFIKQQVRLREIALRYPSARLPERLDRERARDPDQSVSVLEANIWVPGDAAAGQAAHVDWSVWLLEDGEAILRDRLESERTIAFRVDKAPGEVMGRGPVLKALPEIKTANKIVELVLKNASIAVSGIWQAEDDGVLNPANIRLAPGTIIPKAVGSAGLTPLEAPGRFDVSELILGDLQKRIRTAIKGPDLPPAADGVRTAFELGERRADQTAVEIPQTLRLLNECYDRLVRRCLHILSHHSMAGSRYYIEPLQVDDRHIRLVPTSPMVRVQDEIAARNSFNGVEAVAQFAGPEQVARSVKMDDFARWWLKQSGFPPDLIRTPEEVAALDRDRQAGIEALTDLAGAVIGDGAAPHA